MEKNKGLKQRASQENLLFNLIKVMAKRRLKRIQYNPIVKPTERTRKASFYL